MRWSIRSPLNEPSRGLLDTSVIVDHDVLDPSVLPDESAITAITLAELAGGPSREPTTIKNDRGGSLGFSGQLICNRASYLTLGTMVVAARVVLLVLALPHIDRGGTFPVRLAGGCLVYGIPIARRSGPDSRINGARRA